MWTQRERAADGRIWALFAFGTGGVSGWNDFRDAFEMKQVGALSRIPTRFPLKTLPGRLTVAWGHIQGIAAEARRAGRTDLADEFDAKAQKNLESILANCWNDDVGFFTTATADGRKGTVLELHGYAPWYFGLPTGKKADWAQLSDPQGFAARYGLTFPERRAKGFELAYTGHECQWNDPSWPFATSVALTAFINDLHAGTGRDDGGAVATRTFNFLLWQYAAQQKRTQSWKEGGTVQPWIDENANPDKPDWISRTIIGKTPTMNKKLPKERGKDYNHSTFCDLVISGLVGIVPNGAKGVTVDPLFPPTWDYLVLENLRCRGHDIDVRWCRATRCFTVSVDGKAVVTRERPSRCEVAL